LNRKLLKRQADQDLVAEVLDTLERQNYLSDERFTQNYVSYRQGKGYGPRRIQAELKERGISSELIRDWLDINDPDWFDRMKEVANSRFGEQPEQSRREQARRARFLEYRGFLQSHIRRLLWDE